MQFCFFFSLVARFYSPKYSSIWKNTLPVFLMTSSAEMAHQKEKWIFNLNLKPRSIKCQLVLTNLPIKNYKVFLSNVYYTSRLCNFSSRYIISKSTHRRDYFQKRIETVIERKLRPSIIFGLIKSKVLGIGWLWQFVWNWEYNGKSQWWFDISFIALSIYTISHQKENSTISVKCFIAMANS